MKLYNQTRSKLTFEAHGKEMSCEPFGEVEVSETFLPFVERRQIPLKATPVPPEQKAAIQEDESRRAADASEVVKLRKEKSLLEASLREAEGKIRESGKDVDAGGKLLDELQSKVIAHEQTIDRLKKENGALESKLAEAVTKAAKLEAEKANAGNPGVKKTTSRK
jgi:chromosome segregation ATPase